MCQEKKGVLTHLWALVRQPFHYLWGSVERTSTVSLQQRALLEMIGKAEVSQLERSRGDKIIHLDCNDFVSGLFDHTGPFTNVTSSFPSTATLILTQSRFLCGDYLTQTPTHVAKTQ